MSSLKIQPFLAGSEFVFIATATRRSKWEWTQQIKQAGGTVAFMIQPQVYNIEHDNKEEFIVMFFRQPT
jgi:hypothetical protein